MTRDRQDNLSRTLREASLRWLAVLTSKVVVTPL